MNINRLTAVALIAAVALAGCSGMGPMGGSSTPSPTEATQTTTSQATTTTNTTTTQSTPEQTATATPTSTPYVATPPTEPTPVPTETWTKPPTPKSPEDKGEDRISSVKFINKKEAPSGSGYTDFDVQVSANTMMQDIDPTPSKDGEPYFYVEINGEPIAREEVSFRTSGVFTIKIHPGALKQFDSGTLEVSVTLYDDDHKYHDEYGTWTGTIEYSASNTSSDSNSN